MAITPNNYSFTGGAFMGGDDTPVARNDIHSLNITKNGESIGNYNPLVGDADVDIPSDAVVISFSTFSGAMPGSAYSKMASAVGAGQVVMLRSVSGASVVYWTLLAASVLSYKFISVSETAVLTVEIQTSGDSSGNHAFTISNVPLTELRVIDTGASSGDDRGHEHTRIIEALTAGKTVCIKYTSGNNIAYGTLCGAHDGHYTFIVDYGGTPSVLTVIADGSMQISAIFDGDASEFSVTPDGTSTSYNITGPTLLKSFLQKFKNLVGALKALAFKDKASYNDLSSGVQSSLDKADSALQSHQSVTDNNPTLAWGTTSKVGKVGSTDLQVTMPANPAQNLPASVITSGTFGTDRIADDAITADKVKDNETLPVNISGTAKHLDCYGFWHTYGTGYYDPSKPYAMIGEVNLNISGNTGAGHLLQFELDSGIYARIRLDIKWSNGLLERANVLIIDSSVDYSTLKDLIKITHFTFTSGGNTFLCIRLYVKFTGDWQVWRVRQLDCQTGDCGYTNWADFPFRVGHGSQYAAEYGTLATYKFSYPYANGQVGSPSTPVYVDPNGQVQPCTANNTLKSNTATLYIAGYYENVPYYNIKDIKNGCVNYVHVKDTLGTGCNITIEAPVLAAGEEYDYVVVFDTFTNNGMAGNIDVENCKKAGHFENGVFVTDMMTITNQNPQYVPMIIVTGNIASSKWYSRT